MNAYQPLKGYRVLELASVLAGPSIGMFLAELGADVIKVENLVTEGDVTRKWKLPTEADDTDISGYFSCVNWGKRSIAVDITSESGLEIVYRLAKSTDIILASYKPGDAEKLKVDYSTFTRLNRGIIYAHLTGYGLLNNRAGFDAIIQAETGFTYMNGESDGPPTKMPVALMDILAAHHLKEAILLSLLKREKGGEGSYIDASLFRAGVSSLANQATNWLVGSTIPRRMGSDHPNIVPYGTIFNTSDNKGIVLAVGTEKQFRELCAVIGQPDLASDDRYSTNFNRVRNKEQLNSELQKIIGRYDRTTILKMLDEKRIPAGGVFNMKEVFETPEAGAMIIERKIDKNSIRGVSSIAFSVEGFSENRTLLPPPHYGEHSLEVLIKYAGYNDNEITRLTDQNIVYAKE
ncbi:MAG: CoA transferase [Bacteroidales bacterium]|nr:CoA transferase [Bacteroidales bacterium]